MSAYTDAIGGEEITAKPAAVVIVNKEQAGDTFWTAVKWLGAALVLVTAYREVKAFRTKLENKLDGKDEEAPADAGEED